MKNRHNITRIEKETYKGWRIRIKGFGSSKILFEQYLSDIKWGGITIALIAAQTIRDLVLEDLPQYIFSKKTNTKLKYWNHLTVIRPILIAKLKEFGIKETALKY